MRISNPKAFNGDKLVKDSQLNSKSAELTALINKLLTGIVGGTPGSGGYAYLTEGKVDPTLMPPLAISEIYTKSIANADITKGTTTVTDLIKLALGAANVQSGDVVILSAGSDLTVELADEFCGSFIYKENVEKAGSKVTVTDFAKIYVPGGSVTSVNGVAPINGSILIDASDIYINGDAGDTIAEKFGEVDGAIADATAAVDTEKSRAEGVEATLSGRIGDLEVETARAKTAEGKLRTDVDKVTSDLADEVTARKDAITAANAAIVAEKTRAEDIEGGLRADLTTANAAITAANGAITAEKTRATGAEAALGDRIDTEADARDARDAKLTTAVNKAIELVTTEHKWVAKDRDAEHVYTHKVVGMKVIQVCDASGWVFPGVKFVGNDTEITVDVEDADGTITDETWTFYGVKTITVEE